MNTDALIVNGHTVHMIAASDPSAIDYSAYGIHDALIIDNTGVGDDVWDFVISDSFSFNLQQFVFRFCVLDWDQSESALNVIEHSVVLVGLWDLKNT